MRYVVICAILFFAACVYVAVDNPSPHPVVRISQTGTNINVVFYGADIPIDTGRGYNPVSDKDRWAVDFLAAIGNPNPTSETVLYLVAWQKGEESAAAYNPLATTQPRDGDSCFNIINGKCGVRNYVSYEDGIAATIETLQAPYTGYSDILAGLQTNDPERALRGLYASPWGTTASTVDTVYRELTQRNTIQLTATPVWVTVGTGKKTWPATSTQVNANFYLQDCRFWSFQAGCQHFGTDIHGGEGDPVFMPFDGTFMTCIQQPENTAYVGLAWMAKLTDGSELYIGHMRSGLCDLPVGAPVSAGTQIGTFRGDTAHIHMQVKDSAGNLVDFEGYFAAR